MSYEPGQRAYKGFHEAYRGYNAENWKEESEERKELWRKAEEACLVERNDEGATAKVPAFSDKEIEIGRQLYNLYTKAELNNWQYLTATVKESWFGYGQKVTNYLSATMHEILKENETLRKTESELVNAIESYRKGLREHTQAAEGLKDVVPGEFQKHYVGQHMAEVAGIYIRQLEEYQKGVLRIVQKAQDTLNGIPIPEDVKSPVESSTPNICICGHSKSNHWQSNSQRCGFNDCDCKGYTPCS